MHRCLMYVLRVKLQCMLPFIKPQNSDDNNKQFNSKTSVCAAERNDKINGERLRELFK